MTCVVAIRSADGTVWMGADSASVDAWRLEIDIESSPKITSRQTKLGQPFLIGFTSSWRMGQILASSLTPPPVPLESATPLFEYMTTSFVDECRRALKAGGFAHVENNVEQGGSFLVAVGGRVFELQSDFSVLERSQRYFAVGCGAPFASAALSMFDLVWPKNRKRPSDKALVEMSLGVAEKHSAGVRGPFVVKCLKNAGAGT